MSGRITLGVVGFVVAALALTAGCNDGSGRSSRASATAPITTAPVTTATTGAPPAASVQSPISPITTTTVRLDYALTDAQSDAANVVVEYSIDDGRTFSAAKDAGIAAGSQGTVALATSPAGAPHVFVWDAASDLGRSLRHFVRVRVTPTDKDGVGAVATTTTFTVDATTAPTTLVMLVVPLDPAGVDRVTGYDVSTQGVLSRHLVQPAAVGNGRQMSSASGIVATPRGDLVVASHNDSRQLDVFRVGAGGALTRVAGSPFTTNANPTRVAMHPNGRFVYTTNGAALEGFALDATTGALTALPGSPFNVGSDPRGLAIDPRGDALYTGHMFGGDRGVRVHRLDPATGALTLGASSLALPTASRPGQTICVDARGERLYCLDLDAGLFVATIDAQTRALTPVQGASPRSLGGFAHGLAISTRGDKVYATVSGIGLIGLRVTATGFATVPGSPVFNVGGTTLNLHVDPSDRFLFASSRDADHVHTYALEPVTGAAVEVPGSPRYNVYIGTAGPVTTLAPR